MTLHIAVYGDVDLNLLDGSSIWLASLVETLARGESTRIKILPKKPRRRDLLTTHLQRLPAVRFIGDKELQDSRPHPLSPQHFADLLERYDRDERFDVIIVRGRSVALEISQRAAFSGRLWSYMTDMPQAERDLIEPAVTEVREIVAGSRYLLCQTEELRSFLETHFAEARGKTLLLPPMIPDQQLAPKAAHPCLRRLVYAGKFSPHWGTCEMLDVFARLHTDHPDLELHVFGDKIHDPPDAPGFRSQVKSALERDDGVVWHRAIPRAQLVRRLPEMDLAWGWRRPELNRSLELSTKLLEYGAAGLPVLLNRAPMYERLLGINYPLFATSPEEAFAALREVARTPSILAEAAVATHEASRAHTFSHVYRSHLREPLKRVSQRARVRAAVADEGRRVPTFLLAGHDLRFIRTLGDRLAELGAPVLTDRWLTHSRHDEVRSRELLSKADVLFCEWCLGNSVWYAHNKRDEQRLVVRLHRQERDTDWPARLDLQRTDRVIFISEAIREEVIQKFGWPRGKTAFIPNYVDVEQLRRPKLEGARYNLGMIGICPSLKRLDRALDILEALRAVEPRFTLYIKSRMPWDYDWLWRKAAERQYYEAAWRRIESSPLLARSVVFDEPGDDVPLWLRKIGFLLSTSDFEGSHQAVAEAAASGSLAVVLPWVGADSLYPDWFLHTGATEAARSMLEIINSPELPELRNRAACFIEERYRPELVLDQLLAVILGEGSSRAQWAF